MGYEYRFRITPQDLENLSRCQDGINTLEKLLAVGPGFIEKNDVVFLYSDQPENEHRWPSTIHVDDAGFCLGIYQRTANSIDQQLLNFLMQELLNRCGRLEVADA